MAEPGGAAPAHGKDHIEGVGTVEDSTLYTPLIAQKKHNVRIQKGYEFSERGIRELDG